MIRVRYLDALERERFELLPAGPYGRSFLREYAEFLELDGDIYTREYELRVAPPEPEVPRPPSRPGIGFARRLGGLSLTWAVVVLGATALVGLAVWQLGGPGGRRTVNSTPPRTTQPATHVHHPAVTVKPLAKRSPPLLTLTAVRGSCWLSVRIGSSTGATVYAQTLQPGQTARFGLRKPLWIRVGAPWNLDATLGRHSITSGLPPRTGDMLATATGLRATS